jgi:hypothetical protein
LFIVSTKLKVPLFFLFSAQISKTLDVDRAALTAFAFRADHKIWATKVLRADAPRAACLSFFVRSRVGDARLIRALDAS